MCFRAVKAGSDSFSAVVAEKPLDYETHLTFSNNQPNQPHEQGNSRFKMGVKWQHLPPTPSRHPPQHLQPGAKWSPAVPCPRERQPAEAAAKPREMSCHCGGGVAVSPVQSPPPPLSAAAASSMMVASPSAPRRQQLVGTALQSRASSFLHHKGVAPCLPAPATPSGSRCQQRSGMPRKRFPFSHETI